MKKKSYQAGAFGLGKLPEILLDERENRATKADKSVKTMAEPSIAFADGKEFILLLLPKRKRKIRQTATIRTDKCSCVYLNIFWTLSITFTFLRQPPWQILRQPPTSQFILFSTIS